MKERSSSHSVRHEEHAFSQTFDFGTRSSRAGSPACSRPFCMASTAARGGRSQFDGGRCLAAGGQHRACASLSISFTDAEFDVRAAAVRTDVSLLTFANRAILAAATEHKRRVQEAARLVAERSAELNECMATIRHSDKTTPLRRCSTTRADRPEPTDPSRETRTDRRVVPSGRWLPCNAKRLRAQAGRNEKVVPIRRYGPIVAWCETSHLIQPGVVLCR